VLRRALIGVGVLVAVWIAFCLVFFVWSPWATSDPARADAIVVLSGGRERLPAALTLARRGVAPVLAISTVSRTPHFPLGRELCRAGRYEGVRVVCFDAVPYSTVGEADAARQHGWSRIVVVTSRFHTTRAHMLFRRCDPDAHVELVGTDTTWWKLPRDWASETAKLAYQLTAQRGC
jgi:uncharacterized SAM-binding protein YcdF (DUF218 family)